jgi:hypothetical protein
MNWEAIGAIGEILGALAVVVSILYLSIQIRSNTRATKASASFDATHSWALSNEQAHGMSAEDIADLNASYDINANPNVLSEVGRFRVEAFHRALFQKLEGQYFLYKFGYLEPDLWEKRSAWAHGVIQLPFYRNWWENELTQSVYSDEFVNAVTSVDYINVAVVGGRRDDA